MAEGISSEFLLGFQTFCAGSRAPTFSLVESNCSSNCNPFTLVHTVQGKCDNNLAEYDKSLDANSRKDSILDVSPGNDFKRDFHTGHFIESQRPIIDGRYCDPPHREIIARFQRLKTVRHPHLCLYTNILRSRDRIFVVSEHWSLSLEDILAKWKQEDAHTAHVEDADDYGALSADGEDAEPVNTQQINGTDKRGIPASYLRSVCLNHCYILGDQMQHRRAFIEKIVGQTLTALEYLNSLGMCHNRIEPRTIRIDAYGNVKLSEWGFCFLTRNGALSPLTNLSCSFLHLAPEQVVVGSEPQRYSNPGSKQDIWALGIVLLQLLSPCWSQGVSLRVAAQLNGWEDGTEWESASAYIGAGTQDLEGSDSAHEDDGYVEDSDVAILNETLEKISQLVFYCWLGIKYQILHPHSPEAAVQQNERSVDEFARSTHLSLIGTDTYREAIIQLPLLERMMKCAAAFPCYMADPKALRSVIRGFVHSAPVKGTTSVTGVPSTDAKPLLKTAETLLFRHYLKEFAKWISGAEVIRILKQKPSQSRRPHVTKSPTDTDESFYSKRCATDGSASVSSTPSSFANTCSPQRICHDASARSDTSREWVEDLLSVLRSCLRVHPSQRATASDLLGYRFVQKYLEKKSLWVPLEASCISVLTELRVDEELRRIRTDAVEGDCRGSAPHPAVGSHLGVLMLHHNTSIDEIFYWWQLQGGDIFSELQKSGAFRPIPRIFEVPICMVHRKRSSGPLPKTLAFNCSCSGENVCEHYLASIPFLAALSDSLVHTATTASARCICLLAPSRRQSSIHSAENSPKASFGLTHITNGGAESDQSLLQKCGDHDTVVCNVDAGGSAVEKSLTSSRCEESFFLTGFQKGRDWREAHLWNVEDARVFGVSVEETVRAIEEADKFPVAQMMEVRPTCVYRRQCHFLYQRLRVRMFKSLLAQLPKSRPRLFEEAASDIPPLLRSEIWCILLGVSTVEVRDPDFLLPCECEHNAKRLQGLHHEEFSKFHEYDDLLGSQEGRLRLQRILHRILKANPFYICVRGLDAIGAPFLSLNFNREWIAFCCLNQFLKNFQRHLFESDNKNALKSQMQISEKLLMFVDAELALHLQSLGLHFDLYAVSWHLTMFSHALPLPQLLLLWDSVLVQPPSFIHFLIVCILHLLRVPLLGFGSDEDSSAIKLINASFDFLNIPMLCATANALQNATPWTITLQQLNKPVGNSSGTHLEGGKEHDKLASPVALQRSDLRTTVQKESLISGAHRFSEPNSTHLQERVTNTERRENVVYFGVDDESPGTSIRSSPSRSNSSCEINGVSGNPVTASESLMKRRSSWRARAFVDVMKTPAMLLMGAPRKPLTTTKNANISEDESVDPLDSLYDDSPSGRRWWEDMSEASFLQISKPCWNQMANARSPCQNQVTHSPSGIHVHPSGMRTPEPPCVGIDVLLHFHEESILLDIRNRFKFLSEHFIDSVNIRPKDIPDLLSLFAEFRHVHDISKAVANVLKKGGIGPSGGPRVLAGKSVGKSHGSYVTKEPVETAFLARASFDSGDNDLQLQKVNTQGSVAKVSASEPWINPGMGKMGLVVIIGDRHDSGAGLAQRLQLEGVSGVCILLGGFDAVKQDAPSYYLVSKT